MSPDIDVEFEIKVTAPDAETLEVVYKALIADDDEHVTTKLDKDHLSITGSEKAIMSALRTLDDVLASLITVEKNLIEM